MNADSRGVYPSQSTKPATPKYRQLISLIFKTVTPGLIDVAESHVAAQHGDSIAPPTDCSTILD